MKVTISIDFRVVPGSFNVVKPHIDVAVSGTGDTEQTKAVLEGARDVAEDLCAAAGIRHALDQPPAPTNPGKRTR